MKPTLKQLTKICIAYYRALLAWRWSRDWATIETDAEMNAWMQRGLRRTYGSRV